MDKMRNLLLITFFYFSPFLSAKPLLDFKTTETAEKDTSVYDFGFTLRNDGDMLVMNLKGELKRGTLNVWFGGGGWQVVGNYTDQGEFLYKNVVFGPLNNREPVKVRATLINAVGKWHIRFSEVMVSQTMLSFLISGILVIAIVIFLLLRWKAISGSPLKWILIGGGVWAVGVTLKIIFAYIFNKPVLSGLAAVFGETGSVIPGSIYLGLLTGIFEIGATAAFAYFIKDMYKESRNGVSIGLGAGATEALLIGLSQIGNIMIVMSGVEIGRTVLYSVVHASLNTPFFFLLAPAERLLTILCHISSRALVLVSFAKKRYIYFWGGFFLLSAIDMVAGYAHLAGLVKNISLWWIEFAILPFALLSIPIIKWCIKNWRSESEKE
ncbi:MAG TPA: YhfC family intramembrane metalloprotease [Thermoplasmata archaeon]|nr:YhfC family intramembrane metalloprotease [Thermoplasmata archaeon]